MDALFALSEAERSNYFRFLVQHFRSTYICLWVYAPPPSNCFFFLDGFYREENGQSSSSSGSLSRRLFDDYRREPLIAVNNCVPGLAYRNNSPYVEIKELELQRMASTDAQRRFYQAAGIKIAVFMGCRNIGEIEVGWSNVTQTNAQSEMRNWFLDDFPRQSPVREFHQTLAPSKPSSSSSSLRSPSMDSPDSSPLLFNIPSASHMPEAPQAASQLQPVPSTTSPLQEALAMQSLRPTPSPFLHAVQPLQQIPSTSSLQEAMKSMQPTPRATSPLLQAMLSLQSSPTTSSPLQEAMQTLQPTPTSKTSPRQQAIQSRQPTPSLTSPPQQNLPTLQTTPDTTIQRQAMQQFALTRNIRLPTPESEEAMMTRAILAVLTSASSSSSSTRSLAHIYSESPGNSAFKNYRSALAPIIPMRTSVRRRSMLKQAIAYYKNLNTARREQFLASRPTNTQLHHMISERKRREKINESFDALRSLLPPDAKKDKASVLTLTREYLISLKAQVEELSRKNQQLEGQISRGTEEIGEFPRERLGVRVTHVSESTSEQRIVDLQVSLRGDCAILDVVIRILEFLKQDRNVSLMSVEANTHTAETMSFSRAMMRLNIENNEWDESAFQEAVRRVVEDLAH